MIQVIETFARALFKSTKKFEKNLLKKRESSVRTPQTHVDVVIVGAGIAGLWLHAHLKHNGWSALILENIALGYGQSVASQGIIHGGTKYNLTGTMTRSAKSLAAMPEQWRNALQGKIAPDLSAAKTLSEFQFLCSTPVLSSKFIAFAARTLVKSRIRILETGRQPAFLDPDTFKGRIYRLDEPVLDVPTILRELSKPYPAGSILKIDCENGLNIKSHPDDDLAIVTVRNREFGERHFSAKRIVFTAGLGNENIKSLLPEINSHTQRRPLHMVLARFPAEIQPAIPPVYSHFLGTGALPRATITTHYSKPNRDTILYVGGEIAESGVERSISEQIIAARKLLNDILPTLPIKQAQWATFRVDRAEPRQPARRRPDTSVAQAFGNTIIAWPTKLALAPHLAQQIESLMRNDGLKPDPVHNIDATNLPYDSFTDWPRPKIAPPPWDRNDLQWTDTP